MVRRSQLTKPFALQDFTKWGLQQQEHLLCVLFLHMKEDRKRNWDQQSRAESRVCYDSGVADSKASPVQSRTLNS